MELSTSARIMAFAAVVVVLAGLGLFLFLPQRSDAGSAPGHSPSPAVSPASSHPPATSGHANIYQWLPFTSTGLASAAAVTTAFTRDYGTFSYTSSTATYLAPMRTLASSQLVGLIGRAYAAPGVAATRSSGKQAATATAAIVSLRAFGPTSLTFVVQLTQRLTGTSGSASKSADYAVTVTGAGTSWQVSDIELATAGNH
jgi:hypothetical protein